MRSRRAAATVLAALIAAQPTCATPPPEHGAVTQAGTGDGGGHTPTYPPNSTVKAEAPIKLPGGGGVTDGGGASYSLPLWVPDGPHGMQPELSISYSPGGNGHLGTGWTLSGQSAISPCRKTFAAEGFADGVDFDAKDVYCLDGAKLVLHADPDHPAPATGVDWTYRTEVDRFDRIVAHRTAATDDQPTSWTIYARDGRIHTYTGDRRTGVSAPQRHNPDGGPLEQLKPKVYVTYLRTRTVDRDGNRIEYDYQLNPDTSGDDLSYRLRSIGYSYAGGTAPRRRVDFIYDATRPDPIVRWARGVKVVIGSRLKAIEMWAPNPVATENVWTYHLRYLTSPDTGRSRLSNIQLCEKLGGCSYIRSFSYSQVPGNGVYEHVSPDVEFNGLSLSYSPMWWDLVGPEQASTPEDETDWVHGTDTRVLLFDVDHDGDDDALYRVLPSFLELEAPWFEIDEDLPDLLWDTRLNVVRGMIMLRRSGATGPLASRTDVTELLERDWGSAVDDPIPMGATMTLANLGKSRVADTDGDGEVELMLARTKITNTPEPPPPWSTYLNFDHYEYGYTTFPAYPWNPAEATEGAALLHGPVARLIKQMLGPKYDAQVMAYSPPFQRAIADVDGDGRSEAIDSVEGHDLLNWIDINWDDPSLVHQEAGGFPYHATVSSSGEPWIPNASWTCSNGQIQILDVDGDGRHDVLESDPLTFDANAPAPGLYRRMFSADPFYEDAPHPPHGGAAHDADSVSRLWAGDCSSLDPDLVFGDWNGDGLADALYPPGSFPGADADVVKVRWNLGTGFGPLETISVWGAPELTTKLEQVVPDDIYGNRVRWDRGTRVADVDHDGRSDLVAFRQDAACAAVIESLGGTHVEPIICDNELIVYRSHGDHFVGDTVWTWNNAIASLAHGFTTAQIGDVTGDGALDAVHVDGGRLVTLELPWRTTPDRLVGVHDTSATFPLETFTYTRQWWGNGSKPQAGPGDDGPAACPWPLACSARGFEVVRQHQVFAGTDLSATPMYRTTIHTYAHPVSSRIGRGHLGFTKHTIWDRELARETTRVFDPSAWVDTALGHGGVFHPYVGEPTTVRTVTPIAEMPTPLQLGTTSDAPGFTDGQGVPMMVTVTTTMREVRASPSGRVISVVPTLKTTTEHEGDMAWLDTDTGIPTWTSMASSPPDRMTRTTYEHDPYGNVTLLQSEVRQGIASQVVLTTKTATTYDNSRTAAWLIGLPVRAVDYAYDHDDAFHPGRVTRTTYDANARATSVETKAIGPGYETCFFATQDAEACEDDGVLARFDSFDAFGNPATIIHTAADSPTPRVSHVAYDAEGVYPISRTDPGGFTQHALRHPALGEPILEQDALGVITLTKLDGFGRMTTRSAPGLATITRSYATWTSGPSKGMTVTDSTPIGGGTTIRADEIGRAVVTSRQALGGQWSKQGASYDPFGNVVSASVPAFALPAAATRTHYDRLGRVIETIGPVNELTTHTYTLFDTTTVDPEGHERYMVRDLAGRVIESGHRIGGGAYGEMRFGYGPFDEVEAMIDAASNTVVRTHDPFGRVTHVDDPDRGRSSYVYDGYGQVVEESPATGGVIEHAYDALGRLTTSTLPGGGGVFTRVYDVGPGAAGQVTSTTSPDGVTTAFAYDPYGRTRQISQTVDAVTHTVAHRYDAYGRIAYLFYPEVSGFARFTLEYKYNTEGYLRGIYDVSTCNVSPDPAAPPPACVGVLLWQVDARDARMALTKVKLGNAHLIERDYDPVTGLQGRLASAGREHKYYYTKDGLLKQRVETTTNRTEDFTYDPLHRLDTWTLQAPRKRDGTLPPAVTADYDYTELGDLEKAIRPGLPTFTATFGAIVGVQVKPRAMKNSSLSAAPFTYDARGRQLTGAGRTIAWNELSLPTSIADATGTRTMRYDAHGSRVKRTDATADVTYLGRMFEQRTGAGGNRSTFYVHGEPGVVAQVDYLPIVGKKVRYVVTDPVGSAVLIETGTASFESAYYDPFGSRVDADGLPVGDPDGTTSIGFTGHEEDGGALVNMRGRIYDRAHYRFLSPDSVLISPLFGQAHNPYAYVLNNPLNLNDPSGFAPSDPATDFDADPAPPGSTIVPLTVITPCDTPPCNTDAEAAEPDEVAVDDSRPVADDREHGGQLSLDNVEHPEPWKLSTTIGTAHERALLDAGDARLSAAERAFAFGKANFLSWSGLTAGEMMLNGFVAAPQVAVSEAVAAGEHIGRYYLLSERGADSAADDELLQAAQAAATSIYESFGFGAQVAGGGAAAGGAMRGAGGAAGAAGGGGPVLPSMMDDTARLTVHLERALVQFTEQGFTPKQVNRLLYNTKLEAAFRGERIDTFFKRLVQADPELRHLRVTPMFRFGPDVYDPVRRVFWDVTTQRDWARHIKYIADYGSPTGLFYVP
jgi:RHS repeat-associated protein